MKSDKNIKVRCWSCIIYMPTYLLEKRLSSLIAFSNLLHYAYIEHDSDVLADGSPAEVHVHITLYFKYPVRYAYIHDSFCLDSSNVLAEPLSDRYTMVNEYFIHLNRPDKYQYPFSLVYSDDIDFWQNNGVKSTDTSVDIIELMLSGESYLSLVHRFGKNFVYHYKAFKELVEDIKYFQK